MEKDLEVSINLSGDGKGKNSAETENNDEDSDNDNVKFDSMPGGIGEDQSSDFKIDDEIDLDVRELLDLLKPVTNEGKTTEPSATVQSNQPGIVTPDWNF